MSYAAYRLLLHRYSVAAGLQETFDELTQTMRSLCYDIDFVATEGDSPAAFGNRIATKIIAYGRTDGAHEPIRYAVGFVPVNPRCRGEPGTTMTDPNRWQPLALAQNIAQNGLTVLGKCSRSSVRSGPRELASRLEREATDRPGAPPELGRTGVQERGGGHHPVQQPDPAEGSRRGARRASAATISARTTGTATTRTRHRRAI
jgi:hypothetical protein